MLCRLAFNNFKNNSNQYKMYFLSVAFNVCIFYVFLSIRYHHTLQKLLGSDAKVAAMFQVGNAMLFVFAVIFIWYSTTFFLMRRKREIGIYALLGVKRSQIGNLMFMETLLAGLISIVAGILWGFIAAQALLAALAILLGFNGVLYEGINPQAAAYTAGIFILIFIVVALLARRVIYRYQLTELFHAESKEEKALTVSKTAALTGVLLLITGYLSIIRIDSSANFYRGLLLGFAGVVSGTMLIYRHAVPVLYLRVRSGSRFYTDVQTVMNTSSVLYRIRKNHRTWAVLSLLISASAASVLLGYTLYYTISESSKSAHAFSFTYLQQDEQTEAEISALMAQQTDNRVLDQVVVEELMTIGTMDGKTEVFRVISDSSLRELELAADLDCQVPSLQKHQAAVLDYQSARTQMLNGKKLQLGAEPSATDWTIVANSSYNPLVLDDSDMIIVVNNCDYAALRDDSATRQVAAWRNDNIVDGQALTLKMQNLLPQSAELSYAYFMVPVLVYTKLLFFMMLFVGVVFISATGSIFCFKTFMEGEDDRSSYEALHQLGASRQEIKRVLNRQAGTMFVMPLLLTVFNIGALLIVLVNLNMLHYLTPVLISAGGIVVIYGFYYLVASRSLRKMILK